MVLRVVIWALIAERLRGDIPNKGTSNEMSDFKEAISWETQVVAVLQQVPEFELFENRCKQIFWHHSENCSHLICICIVQLAVEGSVSGLILLTLSS